MTDFYFERYTEIIDKKPDAQPDNGMLIAGIEDIGMEERPAIARAVPKEARLVAEALKKANVFSSTRNSFTHFSGGTRRRPKDTGAVMGWVLGELPDGASYIAEREIRHEDGAVAVLDKKYGDLYACSLGIPGTRGGLVLNRYEPVNATSMNDRAVLFGLARLAWRHHLDVQPPAINADAPAQPAASS